MTSCSLPVTLPVRVSSPLSDRTLGSQSRLGSRAPTQHSEHPVWAAAEDGWSGGQCLWMQRTFQAAVGRFLQGCAWGTSGLANQVWVAAPPHSFLHTHPGSTFFGPPLAEDWLMPLTFKVLHVISWEADKEEEKHPSGRAVA